MGFVAIYTVKKVSHFPVLSRDVINQTLPSRELLNYSRPGRVWLVTSRLGTGKSITFFIQCTSYRFRRNIPFKIQRHHCIASNQMLTFDKRNTYICLYNLHSRVVFNKIRYKLCFAIFIWLCLNSKQYWKCVIKRKESWNREPPTRVKKCLEFGLSSGKYINYRLNKYIWTKVMFVLF